MKLSLQNACSNAGILEGQINKMIIAQKVFYRERLSKLTQLVISNPHLLFLFFLGINTKNIGKNNDSSGYSWYIGMVKYPEKIKYINNCGDKTNNRYCYLKTFWHNYFSVKLISCPAD